MKGDLAETQWNQPQMGALLRRSLPALIVFLAAAAYFGLARGGLKSEPRFVDEGAILAQTYYYRLLVTGDWRNPDWLHPAAYDHQPMYKYLIGAALQLSGRWNDIPDSPAAWERWMLGPAAPPAGDALWIARTTMLLGAAFACAAIFALGSKTGGWPCGIIAAALFATSPVVFTHARRAMADVLCQGFVAAALAAWIGASRRPAFSGGSWFGFFGAGAASGLAAATKLSGATGLAAMTSAAIAACGAGPSALRRAAGAAALAIFIGAATFFVGIDPYYYCPNLPADLRPSAAEGRLHGRAVSAELVRELGQVGERSPLGRALQLLQYRREALMNADRQFPNDFLPISERLPAVVLQGMGRWSAGNRSYSVEEANRARAERQRWADSLRGVFFLAATCLGLYYAFSEGNADRRAGRFPALWGIAAWPLVECLMLLQNLTLDWDRYYLGVVAWSSLFTAFAVTGTVRRFFEQLRLGAPASADS